MKRIDVLDTIGWAEEMFGSLVTGCNCPRRDVLRAVDAGMAKSAGMVVVCDGDGRTKEPERYREGFVLTEAGKSLLESR